VQGTANINAPGSGTLWSVLEVIGSHLVVWPPKNDFGNSASLA